LYTLSLHDALPIFRRSLVDDDGGAEHEGAGDHPGPHHPAEVGEPEEAVVWVKIETVGEVVRGLDREPGMDVDGAFRASGGAGGVDDHVWIVGGGRQGVEPGVVAGCNIVPPVVPVAVPGDVRSRSLVDDAGLHGWRSPQGGVGDGLERDLLATTGEGIGCDDRDGATVVQARGDGILAEPGKERDVDRTDLAARSEEHTSELQ